MGRKEKIIFTAEFDELAVDLLFLLYKDEYFAFIESAQKYVNKIYDFIEEKITNYPAKRTPDQLVHYGEKYLIYNANNHTTWYIFFSQIEQTYFVKFITNNHTEIIKHFNL